MLTDTLKKPCRKGHWHSEDSETYDKNCGHRRIRTVFHYSTAMLKVNLETGQVIDYSTGHGSVSDQNGMNKLFRALGSNLYYRRKGGAEIS